MNTMEPIEGEAFSWITGGTWVPAREFPVILWRGYLYSLSILGQPVQTARVPKTARVPPCRRNRVR